MTATGKSIILYRLVDDKRQIRPTVRVIIWSSTFACKMVENLSDGFGTIVMLFEILGHGVDILGLPILSPV